MDAIESRQRNDWSASQDEACRWLLEQMRPEGYWVGRVETNSCMEAEWILAQHILGVRDDPKYAGVVRAILREQRADGAWSVYFDAPEGDVNATVECYAALRVAGVAVDDGPLVRARKWIHDRHALKKTRVFTRYWLALLGEWPWNKTPELPPEIIFLPHWAPFSIYQFACWARATIVPLTVLSARRFVRPLPPERRLDVLFPRGRENFNYEMRSRSGFLTGCFRAVDAFLRRYATLPVQFGREAAIRSCLEWIIRHQEDDGAWSGIQPPWIYSLMALRCEGYPVTHPVVAAGLDAFNRHWRIDDGEAVYLQASESPVWDTILAGLSLLEAGYLPETTPQIAKAVDYLLEKQDTYRGDWHLSTPIEPGGWPFERANRFYPDVDDTAEAIIFLRKLSHGSSYRRDDVERAIDRGAKWLLAMQSSNGGWAAFDRNNQSRFVAMIPFADFGETLDPPSVDVTAHVVEALALLGYRSSDPSIAKALKYLRAEQEEDGSWFGRWGVNYIYGTWSALTCLEAIGEDMRAPDVRRAARWLVEHQNADGGWGESVRSYMEPNWSGRGASTPSQTAWAVMGLLAIGDAELGPVVKRGADFLAATQAGGTWNERHYTGAGFPGYGVGERVCLKRKGQTLEQGSELSRGFMLNFHMYRHYFPTMALTRAAKGI